MSYFYDTYSQYFVPGFQKGYYDILILSRNPYDYPDFILDTSTIDTNYIFSVENFNVAYNQSGEYENRLFGEGADNNTFAIEKKEITLNFKLPLRMESWGYTNFSFDALYDYFLNGFKGSRTYYIGRFSSNTPSVPIPVGTSTITIDNIADFLNLSVPFTGKIQSDNNAETSETVTITNVNKTNRTLTFSSPTTIAHTPNISYIYASPTDSERQAQFSLLSFREGFFVGCIVNKISFNIQPDSSIVADIEVKALDIDGKYQVNARDNFNTYIAALSNRKPTFLLQGSNFRISSTTPDSFYFRLGRANQDKFFNGFEGLDISNFEINSITLNLENNLQSIHTLNSKNFNYEERDSNNLLPWAYYSEGRKVSGQINYTSPINPFLLADKLAGPGSINKGGLVYNFGPFYITFDEVTWSPDDSEASVDSNHTKILKWSIARQNLNDNPEITPTGTF
jgi:hypothetical protein